MALSSCEAEYVAAAAATQAILWVKTFLAELLADFGAGSSSRPHSAASAIPASVAVQHPAAAAADSEPAGEPSLLLVDNRSALMLARNDSQHQRTKHIDIRHHFVREHVASGALELQWISTLQQKADLLTKQLLGKPFMRLRDMLLCRLSLAERK